jgi:hypothetical protein
MLLQKETAMPDWEGKDGPKPPLKVELRSFFVHIFTFAQFAGATKTPRR